MEKLSIPEARALTLEAQGFGRRWSKSDPIRILDHLGVIQLDSVNVVARSQDLVAFARMGPHDVGKVHRAIYRQHKGFEYWGHAASWLPLSEYRWFIPRMLRMRTTSRPWWRDIRTKHGDLYDGVLARVRDEGPIGAAAFEDPRGKRGTWWDWKPAKLVLEDLFDQGQLMASGRTAGFARLYDLTERVLPAGVEREDPGEAAAARHLMLRGFVAQGVATAQDAADYFRLRPDAWRPALKQLLKEGAIVPVKVEGWTRAAYIPAGASPPDRLKHRPTFLSPFDNLVWRRERNEQLFGFHYRLEIYTPEAKRRYGYYVLPFLARSRLAGRADFKLDRSSSTLKVHGLWIEDDAATADDVALAIQDLARHLGAERFTVARAEPKGLLGRVRAALRETSA